MSDKNTSAQSIKTAKTVLSDNLGTHKFTLPGPNHKPIVPTGYDKAAFNLAAPKVINNSINSTFGAGTHRTSDLMKARMAADNSIVNPYNGQAGYVYDTSKPFQQFYKDIDKMGLFYNDVTESAGDKLARITYDIGKKKGESKEDYYERVRPVSQTAADFSMSLVPILGNVVGIGEGVQDITEAFDGYDRATGQKLNLGQRAARGTGGALFAALSMIPGGKAFGSTGKLALKAAKNERRLASRAKQLEEAATQTRIGGESINNAKQGFGYSDNAVKAAIKYGSNIDDALRPALIDPNKAKSIEEDLKRYGGFAGRTEEEEIAAVDKAIQDRLNGVKTPEEITEAVRKNEKPSGAQKAVQDALNEIPVNVGSANISRYEITPSDNLLGRMASGAKNSVGAVTGAVKGIPGGVNNAVQGAVGKGQRASRGVLGAIDGALDPTTSTFGKRNKHRLAYGVRDKENPIIPERFATARQKADIAGATKAIDDVYQDAINAALNGVESINVPNVKGNLTHIANIKRNGLDNENAAKAAYILHNGTPAEDAAKAKEAIEGAFEEFDNDEMESLLALLGNNVPKKAETEDAVRRFFENLDDDEIKKLSKAQSENDPTAYKKALGELRQTGTRTNADALPGRLSNEEFAQATKGFDATKTEAARKGEFDEFNDKVFAGTAKSDSWIHRYLKSTIPGESKTRIKQVEELVEEFKKSKYQDTDKLEEALDILGPVIPDAAHMNVADLEQLRNILGNKTFNILFTKLDDGFAAGAVNWTRPNKQKALRFAYNMGAQGNLGRTAAAILATGLSMAGQPYQDKLSAYSDSVADAGEGIVGAHMIPGALIWAALSGGKRFGPRGAGRAIDATRSHVRRNRLPMAIKSIADESDRNRYISKDDIMNDEDMSAYLQNIADARDELNSENDPLAEYRDKK